MLCRVAHAADGGDDHAVRRPSHSALEECLLSRWLAVPAVVVVVLTAIALICASGCGDGNRAPSRESARETVVRFLHLGQGRRFGNACALLDTTRYGDAALYDDLRTAALGSLTSDAQSPEGRKRDVDRKRALATNCRGVLSVIFAELGTRRTMDLARDAAAKPTLWLDRAHTVVVLGRDEAWALTSKHGAWRITTADALVVALDSGPSGG